MVRSRLPYAYRGARARRVKQIRAGILLAAVAGGFWAVYRTGGPGEATAAEGGAVRRAMLAPISEAVSLRRSLDSARGELDLARAQLERWHQVFAYSSRYKIAADLAGAIYDVALAEGIDPDLGFRLVNLESEFNERAVSRVGAIGLTQLMPSTARQYQRGVTRDQLFRRETNLRIGFRYLRDLLREHKRLDLALLVYNRGPIAVQSSRARGDNPSNGYDRIVTKGYRGRGIVD